MTFFNGYGLLKGPYSGKRVHNPAGKTGGHPTSTGMKGYGHLIAKLWIMR